MLATPWILYKLHTIWLIGCHKQFNPVFKLLCSSKITAYIVISLVKSAFEVCFLFSMEIFTTFLKRPMKKYWKKKLKK